MRIAWLVSDLADMGLTCRVIIDSSIKNGWLRCVSGIHAQFASTALQPCFEAVEFGFGCAHCLMCVMSVDIQEAISSDLPDHDP